MDRTTPDAPESSRIQKRAILLSFIVGLLMLAGKVTAYVLTGSAAIFSDAAESVIHVAAVAFAALSTWLVALPARQKSPYGYDRIALFSAGFEGGMIIIAAAWIIVTAVQKWLAGLELEQLGTGTLITVGAALLNLALGWYLIRAGRRTRSLIVEANGKHVLTDSWTSFGVVLGLVLVLMTGWKPFDPLLAIIVAINIVWTGWTLVKTSVRGLMDLPDPKKAAVLDAAAAKVSEELGVANHRLRFRDTGQRVYVSVHLLFRGDQQLGAVHRLATRFEQRLAEEVPFAIEVDSHLEALEDHHEIHPDEAPSWPG